MFSLNIKLLGKKLVQKFKKNIFSITNLVDFVLKDLLLLI